jgi:hypothetical protein
MIRYRIHEFMAGIGQRLSQMIVIWRSNRSLKRHGFRYAGRVPYGDKWEKP